MSSHDKIRAPLRMEAPEFVSAVEMFYPELANTIHDEFIHAKHVHIVEYSDYNIDGFNKDYKEYYKSDTSRGVYMVYSIGGCGEFTDRLLKVSGYYNCDYHTPHQSINLLDVLKHLSDNKEKHMYWFL